MKNLLLIYNSSIKKIGEYFKYHIMCAIDDQTDMYWCLSNWKTVGFSSEGDCLDEPAFEEYIQTIHTTNDFTLIISQTQTGDGEVAMIFDNSKKIQYTDWTL
jgi:hypothetical protein